MSTPWPTLNGLAHLTYSVQGIRDIVLCATACHHLIVHGHCMRIVTEVRHLSIISKRYTTLANFKIE